MPEIFKRSIIRLLKHADYTPLKLAKLAKELGINSEDYPQFKLAFDQLRHQGHVVIGPKDIITLPAMSGKIVGTFRLNPKGFGFVIPTDPMTGDLFIPPKATAGAVTGDIVAAKVVRTGKHLGQMRYSGKIIEILERGQSRLVGTVMKKPEGWIVVPDGTGFSEPIRIDDISPKGAKIKDKVVVEILSWPTEVYLARGVIIEVLGKAGRYDSEIKSIIRQYHLAEDFSENCIKQSREINAKFDSQALDSREDITEKVIITIDPPSAKDFDDAISLEQDSDNNWVLGVHIADVSSFIQPGSPLDIEAKERGNSVYLPGKTIPMLPEILSNGICSLQPDQARYVKSVYITYADNGDVLDNRFTNSLIRSNQRLTYQQADEILKGKSKDFKKEVVELLRSMETLSKTIEKRREKNGMLHLDLPDTELVMDKSGRVVDAQPADDSYPHTMIEMFMVETNEAVARILDKSNVGFMRRIHPEPDSLSMKNMAKVVRAFGFNLPRHPDRYAVQDLLAAVKGKDNSLGINLVVLRSFEKAEYSPLAIGHFALASTHYCHFTSPIRRYADLLVHRVLENSLQKRQNENDDLPEIGKQISFTERQAERAERELKMVLILQMLSDHVGENIDCVVTGLASFGVFVQSKKFGIEGLIPIAQLGQDEWKYNARTQSIAGLRSGCSIYLGRAMKVRIISVNIAARHLNVQPAEPLVKESGKIKKRKPKQAVKKRRIKKSRRKR